MIFLCETLHEIALMASKHKTIWNKKGKMDERDTI